MARSIELKGKVRIENGDTVVEGENAITDVLVNAIMTWVGKTLSATFYPVSFNWKMHIGDDTATATTSTMTELASPFVDTSGNIILPSSQSITNTNPDEGVYRVVYTATWDAGTVSGTLGEVGLILNSNSPGGYGTYELGARLSVADGSFSAITIDTTNPLTITYTLEMKAVGA